MYNNYNSAYGPTSRWVYKQWVLSRSNLHQLIRESLHGSNVRYLSDLSLMCQAVKIYTSHGPQWGLAQPHSVHQNKQPFFVSQAAQAGAGPLLSAQTCFPLVSTFACSPESPPLPSLWGAHPFNNLEGKRGGINILTSITGNKTRKNISCRLLWSNAYKSYNCLVKSEVDGFLLESNHSHAYWIQSSHQI